MEDKYIGILFAIASSVAIGGSFIFTKLGLRAASAKNDYQGAGYDYLKNPIWWIGMLAMIVGELANFTAYTFAPAILVTPLGALSVIIGAVLASIFLKEKLGTLGKLGCGVCLLGSVVIIFHAPSDIVVDTVDEILEYAKQPAFVIYVLVVTIFSVYMIMKVCPYYGDRDPLVYISVCSAVGSVSIMAVKALGIAVKLTLSGNNQFVHASTYMFITVVAGCTLIQLHYFNKSLDIFDSSIVNPIYYVVFTTATITASLILFHNFTDSTATDSISLICGFLTNFCGIYLLKLSRDNNYGHTYANESEVLNIPLDSNFAAFTVRKSNERERARLKTSGTSQSEEMVHLTQSRDSTDIIL
ncbi:HGR060Wp [Eremothecium sinecaudum]|uniref:HGR060Wp n=1 Tax=Eremothecium sinecaudum TaxID=45286 RepID=A0A0X8HVS2_9SACH|nr:HGR060Wp [Eremothecium sinecaudum]AMD22399.1 HGR060Wp [Eremothecium sinecaudum]